MKPEPVTDKRFKQHFLILSISISFLIVMGSVFYFQYEKNVVRKECLQALTVISTLKVEQLVQWNKERLSEVMFFSSSEPVLKYAYPIIAGNFRDTSTLRKSLKHIMSDNRYENISLLGRDGHVFFSVYPSKLHLDTFLLHDVARVFASKKGLMRDFYLCPKLKQARINYQTPVFNADSMVIASMLFELNPLDYLYPLIESWPVPSHTAETYLVRNTNGLMEFISPLSHINTQVVPFETALLPVHEIIDSCRNRQECVIEGRDYREVKVLATVRLVPGTNWMMVSKLDAGEAYASMNKLSTLIVFFNIVVLLLLWLAVAWLYRIRQQHMYKELYERSIDLFHSQEEFAATLYSIGDGVITTDNHGNIVRMNTVAETMTGWLEKAAKGKPIEAVLQLTDELGNSLIEQTFQLVLTQRKKAKQRNDVLLVSRNGQVTPISTSSSPIKGFGGKVYGSVLVFRDQTEERTRRRMIEVRWRLFEYASQHPLNETLHYMVDETAVFFRAQACLFLTLKPSTLFVDRVDCTAATNSLLSAMPTDIALNQSSVWYRCLYTKKPVLFSTHDNPFMLEVPDATSTLDAMLVVPVVLDNQLFALLGLLNKEGGFTLNDVDFATYFSDILWQITDGKRRELHLNESEEKYRLLVTQMQVGLALHELIFEEGVPKDYRFIEVNPAFEQLTGLSREQLIGKTVLEAMPETEPYWIEQYGEVVMSGQSKTYENYSRVLDKYFSVIAYPIGQFQFATLVEDSTERRKMLEALQMSEQNYKTLIDDFTDTVWIIDLNGQLIDTNNAAMNQLGYTKEEILEVGLWGVDALLTEVQIKELLQQLLVEKNQIFETKHRTKQGRLIPVEISTGLVTYKGKTASVCIARDITQRKRDEGFQHLLYEIARTSTNNQALDELLRVVRSELNKVMDATNFYVASYNSAANSMDELYFVNEKFAVQSWSVDGTLSGYVLKSGGSLLLPVSERAAFLTANNLEEVENPPQCWVGVPMRDGQTMLGVLVLQSYTDPFAYDMSHVRILETVAYELSAVLQRQRMIADLIQSKNKAEESDRLKTAFLANISHEIRTPMNGILGFMEMLGDPDLDATQRVAYLDVVNKSGQRLLATINDIVEISKIEAGLIEVHPTATDLYELMEHQLAFYRNTATEKGVSLVLTERLSGQSALVEVDKYKLESILFNLLNNALKFTHQGSVSFGNRIEGQEVLFFVRDTGIGIPSDKRASIFERFVQADLSSTRPYEGSGLGLSIVKAYLEKMGGRIWLESIPEQGTTFYFTIPYLPLETMQTAPSLNDERQKSLLDPVTILIAEDDQISYRYLETLLTLEGFVLLRGNNGEETVALAKEHPEIDLILMDIKMPVMNGLEATKLIRQFSPRVPIIAQTAYAFAKDRSETLEAGCTDFLTKPIARERLLASIQQYVGRWQKTSINP